MEKRFFAGTVSNGTPMTTSHRGHINNSIVINPSFRSDRFGKNVKGICLEEEFVSFTGQSSVVYTQLNMEGKIMK